MRNRRTSQNSILKSALRYEAKQAEIDALRSLLKYKFWMFGYHAARWVQINRLGRLCLKNPFRFLIAIAGLKLLHPNMTCLHSTYKLRFNKPDGNSHAGK